MLSHKTRRGLVLLAAVAGGALLVLARNGVPPPRQWPAAQGQMVCGDGVELCGVLTRQTGLGQGVYEHPTPSPQTIWPWAAGHCRGGGMLFRASTSSAPPATAARRTRPRRVLWESMSDSRRLRSAVALLLVARSTVYDPWVSSRKRPRTRSAGPGLAKQR